MSKRDSNSYKFQRRDHYTIVHQETFLANVELGLRFWDISKTWMDRKKNGLGSGWGQGDGTKARSRTPHIGFYLSGVTSLT